MPSAENSHLLQVVLTVVGADNLVRGDTATGFVEIEVENSQPCRTESSSSHPSLRWNSTFTFNIRKAGVIRFRLYRFTGSGCNEPIETEVYAEVLHTIDELLALRGQDDGK
ncbi:hypothetical protein BV22DRAFT_1130111 [Leucogyrophana mollusca]|uniref:Uncharacterized protein n=1 Tax=Leucogyrophana mollusca TaxID=85980 RepID=A0ACB8BEA6_9AGAM|nr:hypothetical protein BV22DRAFT_1130111 [Leucogyrophana mollusca]